MGSGWDDNKLLNLMLTDPNWPGTGVNAPTFMREVFRQKLNGWCLVGDHKHDIYFKGLW